MTTDVFRHSAVVNSDDASYVDTCHPLGHFHRVFETLGERLNWCLEHRQDRISGPTDWARKAGLKNRTHVVVVLGRWRQGKNPEMGAATVRKLAIAAGVSGDWLASGEGSPDELTPARGDDEYPARRLAVASLRAKGLLRERAIAEARSLAGEGFRLWKSRRWYELLLELSAADALGNEAAFRASMERARRRGSAA